MSSQIETAVSQEILRVLTRRESELLRWMLTGADYAGIAREMGVTPGTVKLYSSQVFQKLKVGGRVELMAAEIASLRAQLALKSGED